jgi:hypothetical protein
LGGESQKDTLYATMEQIRENCGYLFKRGLNTKQYYQKPMFSIHVPGDYNSMSYLIDEYQDFKKISQFCLKRLKQNQIDQDFENVYHKPDPDKAMIPFSYQLEE